MFFNGASLFLRDCNDDDDKGIGGNNNCLHVGNKLMPDHLHPNAKGHANWAEAIVSFMLDCVCT